MPSYKLCPVCQKKKIDVRCHSCWDCNYPKRMKQLRKMQCLNKAHPNSGSFQKGHTTWNRGLQLCSPQWNGGRTKNNLGYIFVVVGYKNGRAFYRLEHRVLMEKFLDRKLEQTEVVHHINGIKDDNRMENLLLCDHYTHTHIEKNWLKRKDRLQKET
jgi:hypothetical protein